MTPNNATRLNLPAIRRNRGVTLGDIAERTKIGTRYFQAIEAEEFDKLPGGIYSVNYIRQYARAIDYDDDVILALYRDSAAGEVANEPVAPAAGRLSRLITAVIGGY